VKGDVGGRGRRNTALRRSRLVHVFTIFEIGSQDFGTGSHVIGSVLDSCLDATGDARGAATEQFNLLTLARVEAGSIRIWASAIAWWIFCSVILYEFWNYQLQ
jgi:hypothetical protein